MGVSGKSMYGRSLSNRNLRRAGAASRTAPTRAARGRALRLRRGSATYTHVVAASAPAMQLLPSCTEVLPSTHLHHRSTPTSALRDDNRLCEASRVNSSSAAPRTNGLKTKWCCPRLSHLGAKSRRLPSAEPEHEASPRHVALGTSASSITSPSMTRRDHRVPGPQPSSRRRDHLTFTRRHEPCTSPL